jgi:hypothetical protein
MQMQKMLLVCYSWDQVMTRCQFDPVYSLMRMSLEDVVQSNLQQLTMKCAVICGPMLMLMLMVDVQYMDEHVMSMSGYDLRQTNQVVLKELQQLYDGHFDWDRIGVEVEVEVEVEGEGEGEGEGG